MSSADDFKYDELEIEISQDSAGQYTVEARCGEVESSLLTFSLPDGIIQAVRLAAQGVRANLRDGDLEGGETPAPAPAAASMTPLAIGEGLFNSIFQHPKLQNVYAQIPMTLKDSGLGIRIHLKFDPEKPDITRLASLPWELMAADGRNPFALSRRTPIVRSFKLTGNLRTIKDLPTLRILRIVSNPPGTADLDLEKERKNLDKAFAELMNVEVVDLDPPTIPNLRRILKKEDFHVIHYMGHGTFSQTTGRGALLLHDEENKGAAVLDADAFKALMIDEPVTRLVYLSACRTAQVDEKHNASPFAGIAPALLEAGVPAVVAMQYPISDNAAITFAAEFYEELLSGARIDSAVSSARLALSMDENYRTAGEWATPVLYLRSGATPLFPNRLLEVSATPTDRPKSSAPRIFFATATSTLVSKVADDLKTAGFEVLSSSMPESEAEHQAEITRLGAEADLFVHVLADQPGDKIPGSAKYYVCEQYNLGVTVAKSQLVIILNDVIISDNPSTDYERFLKDVQDRKRDGLRMSVIRTGRKEIVKEVQNKLAEIADARKSAQQPVAEPRAYLELVKADATSTGVIEQQLFDRGIETTKKGVSSDDQLAQMEEFKKKLRESRLYVMVWGKDADFNMVLNRAFEALKTSASEKLKVGIGVYVPPPVTPERNLPAANFNVLLGDNLDDAAVRAWLDKTLSV